MTTFKQLELSNEVLEALSELGFETPTPIQEKTIPHLLTSSQDLIAFAQTGTGKTAAFGLPAIQLTKVENIDTQSIILCPTRELCMQITKDLTNYSKHIKGLNIVPVYGGASMDTQIRALKKGAHIVVATPGRASDLIRRKKLKLGSVERVILDEADEMLTMGFKEELDSILHETPAEKQTLLFSATMSKDIISITKKYMKDAIEISAARMNTGAENVKHVYYMVQSRDKYEVLKRIADVNPNIYGIVFCRTRRETKEFANKFMQDGYNADALHGDLSQSQRDDVMQKFRVGQLQILVATDVAARGLDVTDLTHIINFSLPDDAEVYIHRSGRTGRAGKSGTSVSIIHTREAHRIRQIENKFSIKFQKELVPSGKDICKKQLFSLIDKVEKVEVDEKQIDPFLPEVYKKLEWLSREDLIKHFVSAEFNRFLTYYKNAKDINIKESPKRDKKNRNDRNDRNDRRDRNSGKEYSNTKFTRFFINVGSKNSLNPARLIGIINDSLHTRDSEIGKIEILKKFSFFEVEQTMESKLLSGIKNQKFEGVPLIVEVSKEKPVQSENARSKSSKSKNYGNKRGDGRKRNDGNRRSSDRDRKSRKKY